MYAPVEVSPNLVPEFTATIPASESRVIFEGVRQVSGASPLTLPGNFVMPGRVRSGPRERPAYARRTGIPGVLRGNYSGNGTSAFIFLAVWHLTSAHGCRAPLRSSLLTRSHTLSLPWA